MSSSDLALFHLQQLHLQQLHLQQLHLQQLKKLKNEERARRDSSYHKSSREHWGIIAKDMDLFVTSLVKEFSSAQLLVIARSLWDENVFDMMICAAKILSRSQVEPSAELWNTLLYFLKSVDGWGLEDALAHGFWKCILHDLSLLDRLEEWTKHPNFWMRRAALVYTLPFAKKEALAPYRKRILTWAASYVKDPEWFIQKAIGWWLRTLAPHDPSQVVQFLNAHWDDLKAVARKESTRKLPITYSFTNHCNKDLAI